MNAADLPLAPTPRQVGRRAGFALLLAALVGAPLALGGVFTEAITASVVVCFVVVALVVFSVC